MSPLQRNRSIHAERTSAGNTSAPLTTQTFEAFKMANGIVSGGSRIVTPRVKGCDVSIGSRFGRLIITSPSTGGKHSKVDVSCDCGQTKSVRIAHLRSGKTQACGCLHLEVLGEPTSHGMAGTLTHRIWKGMKSRCDNRNIKSHHYYGGRGISYSPGWAAFEDFLKDMGECPEGHTIERLDVNGDYEKSNCVWLPAAMQARNKTNTVWVRLSGDLMSVAEAMERLGLPSERYYIRRRRISLPTPQQIIDELAEVTGYGA